MGNLFHSKAHEKLMQYLQDGGENLLQKVLNFVEYGLQEEAAAEDLQKPFHKNTRNFSQLSMDSLKVLFQAFHGQLWAEQLARRLRLQQARQLVYFALGVDPGDSLPERTPCTLAQVCYTRYLDLGEPLQTLEFEEDNSLDWTTKVKYFFYFSLSFRLSPFVLSCHYVSNFRS